MRYLQVSLLCLLAAALMVGCSDKQEEATRLEEEMRAMESAADSPAPVPPPAGDSIRASTLADAGALPAEAVPTSTLMPPAPPGEGYTVQVASCEDETHASYLVGLYRERGYEPFVTTHTRDGQLYYRVRIGMVPTMAEAVRLRDELKDKFSVGAWVDRNR